MKYRIVHFMPDFVSGARYPIAALLSNAEGTRVVRSTHLPGPSCLGSKPRAAAARLVLESIERSVEFERVPLGAGPHVVLGEIRPVPSAVEDVEEWLHSLLGPSELGPREREERSRQPQLRSRGWRFFESWHVQSYVRKSFDPARDYRGWLADQAAALSSITHWVPGRERVMLMEPIYPGRDSLKADLEEVGQRLMAYHDAISRASSSVAPAHKELIVYVLKGGAEDVRLEAIGKLEDALPTPEFSVVDTSNLPRTTSFLENIRTIGATASPDLFTSDS